MSKPWHTLNIDISTAIRADFDFNQLYTESEFAGKPIGVWAYSKDQLTSIVNRCWLDYMQSIGLVPTGIMLFYRDPYFISPDAHVDIRKNNDIAVYAINWVIDPNDDSEMVWYNTPVESGLDRVTEAGTLYKYWPMEDIKDLELTRRTIKNIPTLVNIGVPHNIIVNSKPRWVVSIRFPSEQHVQCWDDATTAYRKFINE